MEPVLPTDEITRLSIAPDGLEESGQCGYCKQDGASICFYAWAQSLTAEDYQLMVDRGWRRSGKMLYRQHQPLSCCPHYTIRLKASTYKPTRDQRQTMNRWKSYIWGEEYTKLRKIQFPMTKEEKKTANNGFDLLSTIHEPEYSEMMKKCPKLPDGKPFEPSQKFEVTLEPASLTTEKFELFKHYQMTVHKEEASKVTEASFAKFLCDTPIIQKEVNGKKLGSYHQLYRLNGRLFAIAVLDLLPQCVSSVYFLYHEDFVKFGMGKLGACREIALALEGGYEYYYLGFYIHSCEKMKYKREFGPGEILDPETNVFVPFDSKILEAFDKWDYISPQKPEKNTRPHGSKFQSPAQFVDLADLWDTGMPGIMTEEEIENFPLEDMRVELQTRNVRVPAHFLQGFNKEDFREEGELSKLFAMLASVVGPELALRVVLCV